MTRRQFCGMLVVLLAASLAGGACAPPAEITVTPVETSTPLPPTETLRLFWVNSYASDDLWPAQIRTGIIETLSRYGYDYLNDTLVFEAHHLDVRQYETFDAARAGVDDAIAAIQAFGPDIVVVSDDEAAQLIIPAYPDETQPFIFCGVTGDPASYDLLRPNVTGALERPRPVETVAMAQAFVASTERYTLLGDSSPTGATLAAYVEAALNSADVTGPEPTLRLVRRWSEWRAVVLDEAALGDFIVLLNFDSVLDEDGNEIAERDIMVWMLEHSPVPVFALSKQGVLNGAVGGLATSGEEQGAAAGRLIIQVAQGTHPSTISITESSGYRLVVNLAAAYHWNLQIPVAFPLAAEVHKTLPVTTQGGQQ